MRQKVAVLFGGKSTEHEVSRISAHAIIQHLDQTRFEIRMIGITKQGDWLPYCGPADCLLDGSWEAIARESLSHSGTDASAPDRKNTFGTDTANSGASCDLIPGIRAIQQCDVILPVLHGQNGEDGTVQGLFELLDIPYVGNQVLASAVGMDKVYAKMVFACAGIPQCRHIVVHRHILLADESAYIAEIESELGYPCFVKPSNSGSSVGVYKVKCREELRPALLAAQRFDRKVVVEEYMRGKEIECAVLGNIAASAAVPGEVVPSKEFYDYEDKYLAGTSTARIPAEIPADKLEEVRSWALKAYQALDCSGLARVDFFYDPAAGTVVLNEINTLPGFTDISMYGKLWAASGLSYSDLLTRLIELAFARKEENGRCFHE